MTWSLRSCWQEAPSISLGCSKLSMQKAVLLSFSFLHGKKISLLSRMRGSVNNWHWSQPSRMTSMLPRLSDLYPCTSVFKRHLPRLILACLTLEKANPAAPASAQSCQHLKSISGESLPQHQPSLCLSWGNMASSGWNHGLHNATRHSEAKWLLKQGKVSRVSVNQHFAAI